MNLLSIFSSASADGTQQGSSVYMIVMIVIMFAAVYFLMIRPQKKQQKREQEMRDSIQIGDEITTYGGIMGKVVTVKDDSLVIETGAGSERSKLKITRFAVQANNTANERFKSEQEAAKAAAAKAKAEKKAKKNDVDETKK